MNADCGYSKIAHEQRNVAEQGAGADRLQRGGTWPFFVLHVLSLPVLATLAAAQLERWRDAAAAFGSSQK